MFRRIAMLVIQEQIRPTKFARKWRRKAKTKTTLSTLKESETKLKCVKPKILTKSNSFRTKGSAKLTTNAALESSVSSVSTFNKSSKSNTPRAPKKEKVKYSNDIFEDVMAEIKKYAKSETKSQPEPIPNALVFDLGGSHASHEDVYYQLKSLLYSNKECHMKSLQYFPMSFRWIILLDSKKSRDLLAGSVIIVNGNRVTLRRYDDIIALEYKKSSRASGFIETVKDY